MNVCQVPGGTMTRINLRQLINEWENRIDADAQNVSLYVLAGRVMDQAGAYQAAYYFWSKAESMGASEAVLTEFRSRGYHHHHSDHECSVCDAFCGLCMLDTCCECMGGDLIECC